MSTIVKMLFVGPGTPTAFVAQLGTSYTPDSTGAIYVAPNDVLSALAAGWVFWNSEFRNAGVTTPAAANAVLVVASVALSNGALTVAAQPDVLRPLAVRIDPGSSAITAGVATLVYYGNDGVLTTDVLSLVAAASTPVTLTTSKGILILNSGTVSGLVGGTSPKIQVGTNATLALPVTPGFGNFTVLRENTDGANGTIGTVTASGGLVAPTTAPNGTHSYSWGYTYSINE